MFFSQAAPYKPKGAHDANHASRSTWHAAEKANESSLSKESESESESESFDSFDEPKSFNCLSLSSAAARCAPSARCLANLPERPARRNGLTSAKTYLYPFDSAYAWWFRRGRWYSDSISSVVAEFIRSTVSSESGSRRTGDASVLRLAGKRPDWRNRDHASDDAARK